MPSIRDNIAELQARIAQSAERSGRSASEITLCAVTKTVEPARIQEAVQAGIRDLGENYYQEAREKLSLLGDQVRWHFIGHLQTNKAKYIAGHFALVQSVDSLELARELSVRAVKAQVLQPILLEVKLDPTATKFGIAPEETLSLAAQIAELPDLRLDGLMGMAPFGDNPDQSRPHFARLRSLFEKLPPENQVTLSMGMTADFEVAIEEGATLVRIGTAIFGRRG
jgi:pyridoxal phosphate enzyme (YggS family)